MKLVKHIRNKREWILIDCPAQDISYSSVSEFSKHARILDSHTHFRNWPSHRALSDTGISWVYRVYSSSALKSIQNIREKILLIFSKRVDKIDYYTFQWNNQF